MEEKNLHNNIEDKQLRKILSDTKLEASDSLRFRIMQQIQTEKLLVRKKEKTSFSAVKNMLSIFGVMYALIAAIIGAIYFTAGSEGLKTSYFYFVTVLVTFICSMFWLLSIFDEQRRSGKHNKSS